MYKSFSDTKLVEMLHYSDRLAFEEIYARYWSIMYISAFNILHDHDSCMDCLQDVFIWVWNKRETQNIKVLKYYLLSAIKYKVTNVIRRSKFKQKFFDQHKNVEPFFNNVDSDMEVKELKAVLLKFTTELPKRCREIFELSRNSHLSNREISKQLGISEKAVERQMTIALKRFRASIMKIVFQVSLIIYYL